MRTLRVAQTSPLDVHRRFSHVLKMNSQIRASSFARFRRVVGLSRVFHHGCFPRNLFLCFIRQKQVALLRKKGEKKRRRSDQLGFNTLNVFFTRFSFQNVAQTREKKEKKKRKKKTKDDERKPLGVHALPNLTPALEILAIVRVSFNKKQEKRRRTFKR